MDDEDLREAGHDGVVEELADCDLGLIDHHAADVDLARPADAVAVHRDEAVLLELLVDQAVHLAGLHVIEAASLKQTSNFIIPVQTAC